MGLSQKSPNVDPVLRRQLPTKSQVVSPLLAVQMSVCGGGFDFCAGKFNTENRCGFGWYFLFWVNICACTRFSDVSIICWLQFYLKYY